MLVKELTYKDHDGREVTQNFHFNLTKAEAVEINLMEDLETVGQSRNPRAIIPVMKRVIQYSFGIKLPNGYFTKDSDQVSWFLASDAYSELFLWLLDDSEGKSEERFAQFINGVVGTDISGRPAPQDHKQKEQDEVPLQQLPSDAHRVGDRLHEEAHQFSAAEIPAENQSAEFQEWLAWKREQESIKADNSVISTPPHASSAE